LTPKKIAKRVKKSNAKRRRNALFSQFLLLSVNQVFVAAIIPCSHQNICSIVNVSWNMSIQPSFIEMPTKEKLFFG
jgi:hypothetical protein